MSDVSAHFYSAPGLEPRVAVAVVVSLPPEIDITNHGQGREAIAEALRDGAAVLIADATRTTFCDCAAVSALIQVHGEAAVAGAEFRIAASSAVRHVIKLTGADHLLSLYPTVAAALDGEQLSAS